MSLARATDKAFWRAWYSAFSWYSARRGAEFHCMNWGYEDGGVRADEAAGEERLPLQLYLALVAGVPLEGRELVDLSCGRGGGLAHLAQRFTPRTALGIDFTPGNVERCRRSFGALPGLRFEVGDAERLPLTDASVDVALSVEASHCYRDRLRFLDEARRVLRPGGWLLWTDFAPRAAIAELERASAERFAVETFTDITPHVLRAMELDAPRRQALISRHAPALLRPLMVHFAAADTNAETFTRFRDGSFGYFLARLRTGERS